MYKVFIEWRDKGKEYYYEGDNIIVALRKQGDLIKQYKNNNNVVSIGYEM